MSELKEKTSWEKAYRFWVEFLALNWVGKDENKKTGF